MTFSAYGYVFGELLMIIMFDLTRPLTMEQQYLVPAIVVAAMSVSLIFMIREPKIKE